MQIEIDNVMYTNEIYLSKIANHFNKNIAKIITKCINSYRYMINKMLDDRDSPILNQSRYIRETHLKVL